MPSAMSELSRVTSNGQGSFGAQLPHGLTGIELAMMGANSGERDVVLVKKIRTEGYRKLRGYIVVLTGEGTNTFCSGQVAEVTSSSIRFVCGKEVPLEGVSAVLSIRHIINRETT
ncbi:hypothetical protein F5984_15140 [Rudanella paleaurantiibacter]|uniref:Uncharacterized protein n=1 Tax=Rudanella paleaurantiibacter TaxID=2614655 RepID=A0A7J5TZH5_9BACT|nr:hypothetical protein [Rudanella paleaurantiibacter]KAB7730475.1 hypothetical protein F5984_15140 [Rudanella paleaurantiibacter]